MHYRNATSAPKRVPLSKRNTFLVAGCFIVSHGTSVLSSYRRALGPPASHNPLLSLSPAVGKLLTEPLLPHSKKQLVSDQSAVWGSRGCQASPLPLSSCRQLLHQIGTWAAAAAVRHSSWLPSAVVGGGEHSQLLLCQQWHQLETWGEQRNSPYCPWAGGCPETTLSL